MGRTSQIHTSRSPQPPHLQLPIALGRHEIRTRHHLQEQPSAEQAIVLLAQESLLADDLADVRVVGVATTFQIRLESIAEEVFEVDIPGRAGHHLGVRTLPLDGGTVEGASDGQMTEKQRHVVEAHIAHGGEIVTTVVGKRLKGYSG